MKAQRININDIRIDGGTQPRVQIDNAIVREYAEQIDEWAVFPPVVVFFDGVSGWLADGFHRYHAYKQAGVSTIMADLRSGTQDDAILYSLKANQVHGLRRTTEDKRKAVATALAHPKFGQWSDRKIADACGVSHPFVAAMRNPDVAERQAERRTESAKRKVESDSTPANPKPKVESDSTTPKVEPKSTPAPSAGPVSGDANDESFEADDDELAAVRAAEQAEVDALLKIAESDDKLAAALAEVKLLLSKLRAAEAARDTAQRQAEQFRKDMAGWKRRAERAERDLAKAAA